jgi:hypothetical protein
MNRRTSVLKKAGIVVAVAAAGLLAATPFAFADDGGVLNGAHGQVGFVNVQDSAAQVPVQACNNSVVEGTAGLAAAKQKNSDSHDGDCDQDNSYDDSAGSR